MTRATLLSALAAWAGLTLVLSELRWFRRVPLGHRLAPYAVTADHRRRALSSDSAREMLAPLAESIGAAGSRLFGVREPVAVRLERIHAELDPAGFRLRQLGWGVLSVTATGAVHLVVHAPPLLAALSVASAPVLAFLLLEQQLAKASERWRRRLFLELPVVAEQLAILLSAGYSVGAAINRLAGRSQGVCASDLRRVAQRVRQGAGDARALREWAELSRVESVGRLVSVLSVGRDAADLGRLVSEEARAMRRDVHRQLLADVERRSQQVWIPVTVAALLPGVVFLAVPFVHALRLFAA